MPVSRLNRRHFLRLTAAGCGLSLLPGMTRADAAAQRPPNPSSAARSAQSAFSEASLAVSCCVSVLGFRSDV